MSAPGPTMKTIQKRFYAFPRVVSAPSTSSSSSRVRSNSVSNTSRSLYTGPSNSVPLSFFDSPPPPPPSSRPGNPHVLSTTRLPVEFHGEAEGQPNPPSQHAQGQPSGVPPYSLALTPPQTNSSSPLNSASYQSSPFFPYPSFSPIPFYNIPLKHQPESHRSSKRHRPRYHFDVGAYGIPKRCRGNVSAMRDSHGSAARNGTFLPSKQPEVPNLAVQVGEDAYFIRDNAMGVADGVGGWAKSIRHTDISPPRHSTLEPSPSAIFARRLMHYCSSEVDSVSQLPRSETHDEASSMTRSPPTALNASWPWSSKAQDLEEDLEDSLEELEEGLDVLMILERAYEKTMKAHVVPCLTEETIRSADTTARGSTETTSAAATLSPVPQSESITTPSLDPPCSLSFAVPKQAPQPRSPDTIPLLSGSSTALLAVLEHSPREPPDPTSSLRPAPSDCIGEQEPSIEAAGKAVIKIAHLGDCMGMLVRGDDIAWRSEEMWWNFNTPVQLGPSSSTKPRDAHIFTLPVEADDILILASDGLSDNLWDEDVLEEVVRFRRSFLKNQSASLKTREGSPGLLGRRTLAGMLSEALCSRARRVSERGAAYRTRSGEEPPLDGAGELVDEVPFARRAREHGRIFKGGKNDDISVIVAVISPANA